MFYYGFDWTYMVFILPCVLLSLFCQIRVSSAFSKYSGIPNSRRMTGAQAAEYVLRQNGVYGVRIEHVAGKLTDHFDPRTNVIRLSDAVYAQTTVAAVGAAVGNGTLTVVRDLGLKDPYVGTCELKTGEIAEDLTYYFATSEQIPSSVGLAL